MVTPSPKTILVTGAAGFIGFHLAKHLLESGIRIIGFDNINSYYDPSLKHARPDILQKYPDFTFIKGDLTDHEAVTPIFKEFQPETGIEEGLGEFVEWYMEYY